MANAIHGELDGIAQDAQGLQTVSDQQSSLMHTLGSTLEGLAPAMKGTAGTAMQQVGEQLHAEGMKFSTHFADHSQKMANNGQILESHDNDGMAMIQQVGNLISGH